MSSRQQSRRARTSDDKQAPRSAKIALIISTALLSTFFIVTLLNALPTTVLFKTPPTSAVRQEIGRVAPQSWAFFTKPPQDIEIGAYPPDTTDADQSILNTPQGAVGNFLGLSRTQRAQGAELAYISNQIKQWQDCVGQLSECLSTEFDTENVQNIENTSPISTICGDVLITQERKIPWGFRNLYPGVTHSVEKVSKIKVNCE